MDDKVQIQEIIIRHLNGEASQEENLQLDQWLAQSPDHVQEFELIKNIWEDTATAALIPVNEPKAWENIRSQTIGNETKVIKLFPWKKTWSIAAAVLLLITVGYFILKPSETAWQETIARDGNKKIRLGDGTLISIRKGSTIAIPQNYGTAIRQVKLTGEGYFEVTHNAQKPFSVITDKSLVKDIGTAFLVKSSGEKDEVTVMEGEVSFCDKKETLSPILMKANESATLFNTTLQKNKADTGNILSWRSGILVFQNTALAKVAKDIKDYYNIPMEVPARLATTEITATFNNESLAQVVKELGLLTGLAIQLNNNKIVVAE